MCLSCSFVYLFIFLINEKKDKILEGKEASGKKKLGEKNPLERILKRKKNCVLLSTFEFMGIKFWLNMEVLLRNIVEHFEIFS